MKFQIYSTSSITSRICSPQLFWPSSFDRTIFKKTAPTASSVTSQANYPRKESYQHPELVVCQRQELSEVMMAAIPGGDRTRKSSSASTGTGGSRSSSRGARKKSRSRSRSKSSERMLHGQLHSDPSGYNKGQDCCGGFVPPHRY